MKRLNKEQRDRVEHAIDELRATFNKEDYIKDLINEIKNSEEYKNIIDCILNNVYIKKAQQVKKELDNFIDNNSEFVRREDFRLVRITENINFSSLAIEIEEKNKNFYKDKPTMYYSLWNLIEAIYKSLNYKLPEDQQFMIAEHFCNSLLTYKDNYMYVFNDRDDVSSVKGSDGCTSYLNKRGFLGDLEVIFENENIKIFSELPTVDTVILNDDDYSGHLKYFTEEEKNILISNIGKINRRVVKFLIPFISNAYIVEEVIRSKFRENYKLSETTKIGYKKLPEYVKDIISKIEEVV